MHKRAEVGRRAKVMEGSGRVHVNVIDIQFHSRTHVAFVIREGSGGLGSGFVYHSIPYHNCQCQSLAPTGIDLSKSQACNIRLLEYIRNDRGIIQIFTNWKLDTLTWMETLQSQHDIIGYRGCTIKDCREQLSCITSHVILVIQRWATPESKRRVSTCSAIPDACRAPTNSYVRTW